VEQATALFAREGYDRVTIKQLAAACGITEPALYRHFDSKEAIYVAVLDGLRRLSAPRDLAKSLASEHDLEVILTTMARHILKFYSAHTETYRLLLFAALGGHEKARQVFRTVRGTYARLLTETLKQLHAEGRVRAQNPEITGRCFVGMVFDCALGVSLWKGLQGKVFSPEEVIANNIPIYVEGLRKSS
jgi:AcrR family transcriptional regulator